jgi:hypothetical protein
MKNLLAVSIFLGIILAPFTCWAQTTEPVELILPAETIILEPFILEPVIIDTPLIEPVTTADTAAEDPAYNGPAAETVTTTEPGDEPIDEIYILTPADLEPIPVDVPEDVPVEEQPYDTPYDEGLNDYGLPYELTPIEELEPEEREEIEKEELRCIVIRGRECPDESEISGGISIIQIKTAFVLFAGALLGLLIWIIIYYAMNTARIKKPKRKRHS